MICLFLPIFVASYKECKDIDWEKVSSLSFIVPTNKSYDKDTNYYDYSCLTSAKYENAENPLTLTVYLQGDIDLGKLSVYQNTEEIKLERHEDTPKNRPITVKANFDTGPEQQFHLSVSEKNNGDGNIFIHPEGTQDNPANIKLSYPQYSTIFPHGNGKGPALFLSCDSKTSRDLLDISLFPKVYLLGNCLNNRVKTLLDNKEPERLDNLSNLIAFAKPHYGTDCSKFSFNNYQITLQDGIYELILQDYTYTIVEKTSGKSINYIVDELSEFIVSLNGNGELYIQTQTTAETTPVTIKATNSFNIIIKEGTWHTKVQIKDNDNNQYSFIYIESETSRTEINVNDAHIFLSLPTTTVQNFDATSLHLIGNDDSTKTFKSKFASLTNLIPYVSTNIVFGELTVSGTSTFHQNSKVVVTHKLTVSGYELPNYIELQSGCLLNLEQDRNPFFIPDEFTISGSSIYVIPSSSEMGYVLCQKNLDCSKFEIVNRGFDYYKKPETYFQIGDIYETICHDYETIMEENGEKQQGDDSCCEPGSSENDQFKDIKCIGFRTTEDVNNLNLDTPRSMPLSHYESTDFYIWRENIKEYLNKYNFKPAQTKIHPLYFTEKLFPNLTLSCLESSSYQCDSTTFVDIHEDYWQEGIYNLHVNGPIYFRGISDSQCLTIPFTSLRMSKIQNSIDQLDFSKVTALTMNIVDYINNMVFFVKENISTIHLIGNDYTLEYPTIDAESQNHKFTVEMEFNENDMTVNYKNITDGKEAVFSTRKLSFYKGSSVVIDPKIIYGSAPDKFNDNMKISAQGLQTQYKIKGGHSQLIDITDVKSNNLIIYDNNNHFTVDTNFGASFVGDSLSLSSGAAEKIVDSITFPSVELSSGNMFTVSLGSYKVNKLVFEKLIATSLNDITIKCDEARCSDNTEVEISNLYISGGCKIQISKSNSSDYQYNNVKLTIKNIHAFSGDSNTNNYLVTLNPSNLSDSTLLIYQNPKGIGSKWPFFNIDDLEVEGNVNSIKAINFTADSETTCESGMEIYDRLYPEIPEFDEIKNEFDGYKLNLCSSKISCESLELMTSIAEETYQKCKGQEDKYVKKCFSNISSTTISKYVDNNNQIAFNGKTLTAYKYNCIGFKQESYSLIDSLSAYSNSDSNQLSSGAIAGIVIAVIIVLIIIIVLIVIFTRKKSNSGNKSASESQSNASENPGSESSSSS
ncbi:hypothetical protein TRFO_29543 [Tritrichomonas foetus]|uniref:Uncharacterized protein n=1 Tax=Tritrichomonas foetus TaxID=1144522 RepID=A0A1J4JVA2_9EUKA|nr:hypothetical protein TRFO_29543 [Tritrichomonas foetus]|eukprot:OHT03087.1 hypothetical protein TRFO_29543 [Tritrichomonas foetus]